MWFLKKKTWKESRQLKVNSTNHTICENVTSRNYHISGIFRVGLMFAEFATSLKSPKIDTAKNKPYYTSSLRVLEIAKIELSENLTHLPSVIFAKISRREKSPIYGIIIFSNKCWGVPTGINTLMSWLLHHIL